MANAFDMAEAIGGLSIDLMEPEFAARVSSAIWQVATGILSGTIRSGIHDQPYGDARTVEQYRESLQELLETFPTTWRAEHAPERSPPVVRNCNSEWTSLHQLHVRTIVCSPE